MPNARPLLRQFRQTIHALGASCLIWLMFIICPSPNGYALAVFVRFMIRSYFLDFVKYQIYLFARGSCELLRGNRGCGDEWHDHAGTNAGEIFTRGGECVEVANSKLAGCGLYLY